jgi:hypothetical protein
MKQILVRNGIILEDEIPEKPSVLLSPSDEKEQQRHSKTNNNS